MKRPKIAWIKFYKKVVLLILLIFSIWFLILTAVLLVGSISNPQQQPISYELVNTVIFFSAVFTAVFSAVLFLSYGLIRLVNRTTLFGKKMAKKISSETAYNLKSILRSTVAPIVILMIAFLILSYLTRGFLYYLTALVLITAVILIASAYDGLLDEKGEASFLLRKFSEAIKDSIETPKSHFPSATKFEDGLATLNKSLPRASFIPFIDKRLNQVELVLTLGDRKTISDLSEYILAVSESIDTEHLEDFDEKYRNLVEFLNAFENEKKDVVELAESVSFKRKLRGYSGEMVKQILNKTVPVLIALLVSLLIYLWLGIPLPSQPT